MFCGFLVFSVAQDCTKFPTDVPDIVLQEKRNVCRLDLFLDVTGDDTIYTINSWIKL